MLFKDAALGNCLFHFICTKVTAGVAFNVISCISSRNVWAFLLVSFLIVWYKISRYRQGVECVSGLVLCGFDVVGRSCGPTASGIYSLENTVLHLVVHLTRKRYSVIEDRRVIESEALCPSEEPIQWSIPASLCWRYSPVHEASKRPRTGLGSAMQKSLTNPWVSSVNTVIIGGVLDTL